MPQARKSWPPIIARAAEIVRSYTTRVSLRQLFYRLVSVESIRNVESDYKYLSRLTAEKRRNDEFPRLLDSTRWLELKPTWADPADALDAIADQYRRDLLTSHDVLPLIVAEKATLVGQLRDWFGDLCVPIAALRGYASETYEREIIDFIERDGRKVELLYCGDFDPSGEDIPRAFEKNTRLSLRRVALDWEQVEEYDLPPMLGKATDSRAAAFVAKHGQLVQVELEAIPPDTLRGLLQPEVEKLIDFSLVEQERQRETEERKTLRELAANWNGRRP